MIRVFHARAARVTLIVQAVTGAKADVTESDTGSLFFHATDLLRAGKRTDEWRFADTQSAGQLSILWIE
jgi:hypothetical protein